MDSNKNVTPRKVSYSPYINPFRSNRDLLDNIYQDQELSVELSDETEAVDLTKQNRKR